MVYSHKSRQYDCDCGSTYKAERDAKHRRVTAISTFPESDERPEAGEVAKAKWTAAYINDLPDAAFLHLEPDGEKDDEGKTTPRTLRHFPYQDDAGDVDLLHLRDALSRIPQSDLPEATQKKIIARAQKLLAANTDAQTEKSEFAISTGKLLRKADEADDERYHEVTAIVLEPNPPELGVTKDTQTHAYGVADIHDAMVSYMLGCQGVGLNHPNPVTKEEPITKGIVLLENWQTKADCMPADLGLLGDEPIAKGTWLQTHRIDAVENPAAWQGVLDGTYAAFSIEGTGTLTPLV